MQWWHLTSVRERWRQCAWMRNVSLLTKATDSNVNPRRVHEAWLKDKSSCLASRKETRRMAQGSGLHFMMFLHRLPNYVAICAPSLVLSSMCWGAGMKDMREIKWINPWPWRLGRFFLTSWFICNQSWQCIFRKLPMVVFWWFSYELMVSRCDCPIFWWFSLVLLFSFLCISLSCYVAPGNWFVFLAISPSYALRYVDLLRRLPTPHILLAVGWDHEWSHLACDYESWRLLFWVSKSELSAKVIGGQSEDS